MSKKPDVAGLSFSFTIRELVSEITRSEKKLIKCNVRKYIQITEPFSPNKNEGKRRPPGYLWNTFDNDYKS